MSEITLLQDVERSYKIYKEGFDIGVQYTFMMPYLTYILLNAAEKASDELRLEMIKRLLSFDQKKILFPDFFHNMSKQDENRLLDFCDKVAKIRGNLFHITDTDD